MRRFQVVALLSVVTLVAGLVSPAGAQSTPGVDLALTVEGPTRADRGTTFPAVLTVTNRGSQAATDVSLTAYVDRALTRGALVVSDPSMTCADGEYGDLVCSLPTLAAGKSASVTLTLTRTMARESWIDAWVASAEAESDPDNNYGGLYLEADRSYPADVAVDMSFPAQPEPNETFDYVSKITNRGPYKARSVAFTQSLSELVEFISVTSSDPSDECTLFEETYDSEGLEGGPYTYSEVRCKLGDMEFATQKTVTVTVRRIDPHELWSSAWVESASFDGNYENDYVDASTAGHPSVTSDLAVTMEGPSTTPLVGDEFVYSISVTNGGPAPAPDAVLNTWLPEQLALRSITGGRANDKCEQDQYGGINCTLAPLASGETATFELAVTRVRAREFWMSASAWSSNYDPTFENSYVEDEVAADTRNPADVGVTLNGPTDPAVGSNFDYSIAVTNNGPNPATMVNLVSAVPEGTDYVSVTSSDPSDACLLHEETYEGEGEKMADGSFAEYTYREVRCELGTMAPDETATLTLTVTRTSEYEVWNNVWVSTAAYDANYDNDYDDLGSSGKRFRGCGEVPAPDDGDIMVVCEADAANGYGGGTKSGSDGSVDNKRIILAGAGDDNMTVRVTSYSKRHRRVVVAGGKGDDVITVLIAPGAGNVTVRVRGGAGNDQLKVIAPRPGKRLKVRQFGGAGRDLCSSERLDRQRSWSC